MRWWPRIGGSVPMRERSAAVVRGMPSLLARAVRWEWRLYRSLARWIARRPDVPADAEPAGYARLTTPVMWLWIFGSAVEIPVAHLLIPWASVRLPVLAVGVWGLLWMLGLLASLHVYPHLLTATGLRIRHGASVRVEVPWGAVRTIRIRPRSLPSSVRFVQREQTPKGTDLQVAVSGEVNVQVVLHGPTTLPTHHGPERVAVVSLLVDDPRAFVARARKRIAQATETPAPRISSIDRSVSPSASSTNRVNRRGTSTS